MRLSTIFDIIDGYPKSIKLITTPFSGGFQWCKWDDEVCFWTKEHNCLLVWRI